MKGRGKGGELEGREGKGRGREEKGREAREREGREGTNLPSPNPGSAAEQTSICEQNIGGRLCCEYLAVLGQLIDVFDSIGYVKKFFNMISVQYSGSALWNCLSLMLKEQMSKMSFKNKVKLHLLSEMVAA